MNQIVKYLTFLSVTVIIAQILGKFFYFHSFRLFTLEIGSLSLIETGLVFLFVWFFQKQLGLLPEQGKLKNVRARSAVLFLFLAFFAGVHLVGGEFQNFFILRKSFGAHMDMATFYDGIGHLFLFSSILILVYWLVRAEVSQPLRQEPLRIEMGLILAQSLILSFGLALTIIKSAFILLCLVPISALIGYFLLLVRRQKTFSLKTRPLYIFFSSTFILAFIWLLLWLVLPSGVKRPFIEGYVSLPDGYEIKTALAEIPILKFITRAWN